MKLAKLTVEENGNGEEGAQPVPAQTVGPLWSEYVQSWEEDTAVTCNVDSTKKKGETIGSSS